MERQWWRELDDTHGIRPDDRSSWRQIAGDLKAAKRDPIQARILTERVRRLRRPSRHSRLVAAERLGASSGHLSRAGRLGGADQALALGQSL